MKLASVKSMLIKGVTVGLLAGAVVLTAPAKAEAQQFAVGVQFGAPGYGYYAPGDSYARQRYEALCRERAFEAQQAYARHEAWEHGRFAYGDRDRDRRDRDDHRGWDRDHR
jgi:hypothetical protein